MATKKKPTTDDKRIKQLRERLRKLNKHRAEVLSELRALNCCGTCGGPTTSGYCSGPSYCDRDAR